MPDLFPKDRWEREPLDRELSEFSMYRLIGSELRVAYSDCAVDGELDSVVVIYRSPDDATNIHILVQFDTIETMMSATIDEAVVVSGPAKLTHDKFMHDLLEWNRRRKTDDAPPPATAAIA